MLSIAYGSASTRQQPKIERNLGLLQLARETGQAFGAMPSVEDKDDLAAFGPQAERVFNGQAQAGLCGACFQGRGGFSEDWCRCKIDEEEFVGGRPIGLEDSFHFDASRFDTFFAESERSTSTQRSMLAGRRTSGRARQTTSRIAQAARRGSQSRSRGISRPAPPGPAEEEAIGERRGAASESKYSPANSGAPKYQHVAVKDGFGSVDEAERRGLPAP
jgi:hypothetical protein